MPVVKQESLRKLERLISSMEEEYRYWRPHQEDIARYIFPRRYEWRTWTSTEYEPGAVPVNTKSQNRGKRNEYILNPGGTQACKTLASGLFNGVTSPSRQWFKLRYANFEQDETSVEAQRWLQEVVRRMLSILAESNFYSAMAVYCMDLSAFANSAILCYEDFDDVVRFYVSPNGEFLISQDHRNEVTYLARMIDLRVHQVVERWGLENCSNYVRQSYEMGGEGLNRNVRVSHLIMPNLNDELKISNNFKYRDIYWEATNRENKILALNGYREKPMGIARWATTANDTYGTGPSHDALPEVIQLQQMTKRMAQGLDKSISPPVIADIALREQPSAFLPGGVSYLPFASNTVGAKPLYTLNLPFDQLQGNLNELTERIRQIYYNPLFTGISDLQTVRSATEIMERTQEKLVMLGPVLQRLERESLDPILRRLFQIMKRGDLLPPAPPGMEGQPIQVQYVSILANAQRAANIASTERFMEIVGQLAALVPEVMDIPNFEEILRDYSGKLDVVARGLNSREEVSRIREARQQQLAAQQEAVVGNELVNAGKTLSETDVGGGQNALQAMLGGG